MQTNKAGIELIKSFESCRLRAYLDGGGVPTIGWGHTRGVRMGQSITIEQAETLFQQDLGVAERAVNSLKLTVTPNQFSAMVSFTFNAGQSNLNKLVRLGLSAVSNRFLLFVYDNHKIVKGLQRRRIAEKKLFDTPLSLVLDNP